MRLSKRSTGATMLAAGLVLAATGCSTKAPESGGGGGGGGGGADVQTDIGVEGQTIRLGVLTDLTGVFAALGKDITQANELFWEDNQVCDTYDVELDVQDTGYVPQQGVQLYSGMKDSILAMQQTIGSPINTALAPEYESDQIVNFPSAWSKTLTEIPGTGVVGATYDVEIANGYDYLFEEGLLAEGDTVGHIYFEGEYGANGLAGTKAVAEEMGLEVIEAQIKATDQDMSAQVTQFAAAGVDLIALTVAPGQTASVATVAEAQGLDVPILGSNPVFAPGLLQGPAADWLKTHLYVASPVSSFDAHPELLEQYKEAYPEATVSLGVVVGFGMSEMMKQVLDAACENGDLTREGVLNAFSELEEVETGGLVVPIQGFEVGKSPSLQSFVLQPADVEGGAKVLADAFEGQFAEQIAG
ncbi:ABC-type branched-chain amino acid transport system, substrate-binding protein [Blastococcus aurantiacus]|uniref:ABC-type branched-chain amino acid transport system, substrate-binding protein n=1 Tax=Blastococcus aurantiacus TaxID=1550231 RepID=A0A1G7IYE7_9ACTN|nr:ABC transporter substrate-binding protein [Blastococcus aurantiacus]SDF17319.1 ABC-type branched-chain amino acid transport system, substrate-binding protein [Blastococcus aurantiacus]